MLNPANRTQARRIWLANLTALERMLQKRVSRIIAKFWREGAKEDNEAVATENLRDALNAALQAHYKRVIRVFTGEFLDESKSGVVLETKLSIEDFLVSLAAFISERGLRASRIISNNLRDRLIDVLLDANEQGLGERETAKIIRSKGLADTVARSRTIARTETHTAATNASREAALQIGATRHVWQSVVDKRTRTSHKSANGQSRPINQPFDVGDSQLLYPGDTSLGASAEEVINCRCQPLYYID